MKLKNDQNHFGLVAICLHWLMAVIIIGMLSVGLYMVNLPIGLQKLKLYGLHKEIGFLVLFLAMFRLIWRITNTTPQLSLPLLEKIAARLMHWAFYGFLFAMPITGWLISSAAGLPISFFGLFTIPIIISPDQKLVFLFGFIHRWLAYALIASILIHSLAALKHHFYDKDDILRRMFP